MIHGVLPRVLDIALPNWGAMLPPNDRTRQNMTERLRIKIRKKAWRTKCFMSDRRKVMQSLLYCWIAIYVERLQSELTWRDQQGKGLWDVVVQDELNPFVRCK
eukprot:1540678-Pyramimonas_sp.AAC.1